MVVRSFVLRWIPAFVGMSLAAGMALAASPGDRLGSDVDGLLEFARANPEFAAMQSEAWAASERVYPAGALPDPTLRVELQNIGNAGSDSAWSLLPSRVGSTKYTVMQSLPWWGKRELREDIARAELAQARGRVAATWAEVAGGVKTSFARYYLANESEALSQEVLEILQRLERIASARYESGLAPQQDVIKAQLEVTAVRSELLTLESEREGARSALNAMLGRDPLAPLARPAKLRLLPPAAALEPAALMARVRGASPQVSVEESRIAVAEKGKALAYRNRYPDVTLGVSPIQMGTRIAEWELMLEVSIPLQQRTRRAQESEARAMLESALLRREAVANRLSGELQENLAALSAARRIEILTTNSLLPQAEATLQAALAGYENGKVDFATLLDAQRQIRRSKLDRIKAQVEARVRLAAIERILGEDL
jgi:outer membrane protein TolC